jgi:hypothetical protein
MLTNQGCAAVPGCFGLAPKHAGQYRNRPDAASRGRRATPPPARRKRLATSPASAFALLATADKSRGRKAAPKAGLLRPCLI